MHGLLPAWTVPAAADWIMHRRTRIQDNAGTRESLIHLLMMAEVGVPAGLVLLREVDPRSSRRSCWGSSPTRPPPCG
ncbi:hypothetical protein [Streptacidiphilus melanogenes]|uniref:hypothetical protein n=1 Tax=Streptacidiphilus melanogenes TaxID=411235 RepID=UPI000AFFAFF2|nr:hypothetical protein [Streptacidiphilus melanogenes]